MKKIKILYTCALLCTLVYSCSTEDSVEQNLENATIAELDSQAIENATVREKLDYKQGHLKTIGNWVTQNYEDVKSFVNSENIENSDYYTLSADYVINSVASKGNAELNTALNAFLNLDNEDWYPTLTFVAPALNSNLARSTDLESRPIIVLDDIENGEQVPRGYTLNEINQLELQYEQLNEVDHGNRDMVILELGQCGSNILSDSPNDSLIDCNDVQGSLPGNGNGGGTNQPSVFRLRIDRMTVKQHKEGWPMRSEVHFRGFQEIPTPQNSGYCGQTVIGGGNCNDDYTGKQIDQLKRSEIGDERNYDYLLAENSQFNHEGVIFYRIFEFDSWPAYKQAKLEDTDQHFYFPNGEYRIVEYRSWQVEYNSQMLSNDFNNPFGLTPVSGFSTDTSAIKYNLTRSF